MPNLTPEKLAELRRLLDIVPKERILWNPADASVAFAKLRDALDLETVRALLDRLEALGKMEQALKGTNVGLKYLMEALDIDPEETSIDIKGANGVVASVTFAELCSRADAALAATEVPHG